MFGKLFNNVNLMQKGLDASWIRHDVISNNIANNDTPYFKSSRVDFESELRSAMEGSQLRGKTTNSRHISHGGMNVDEVNPMIVQNTNTTMRMDGNNVDIEDEMAQLASNSIYYNYVQYKMSKDFGRLKSVINDLR